MVLQPFALQRIHYIIEYNIIPIFRKLFLLYSLGHENVAKLLIDKSVDINAKNKKGLTPLHLAVQFGEITFLIKIISKIYFQWVKIKLLFTINSLGHGNIAKLLIDNRANVSAENNYKDTPLHLSAANGEYIMCTILALSRSEE